MTEREIGGLLVGVVYPAMIAFTAFAFAILQDKLQKDNRSSKRVELKSRK